MILTFSSQKNYQYHCKGFGDRFCCKTEYSLFSPGKNAQKRCNDTDFFASEQLSVPLQGLRGVHIEKYCMCLREFHIEKHRVCLPRAVIKNTATRRTRGCSYVGKTHIPRRHVQRVSGLALAFYFFLFPSLSVSGMLICSPSLSSDSCCRMYSAIRLVFFPVVST